MPSTATGSCTLAYSGDVNLPTETFPSIANPASPAQIENRALAMGDNAIAVPPGSTAVYVTKANGASALVKLKKVNGDTGFELNLVDPDRLSLHATNTAFVLNASVACTVKLWWY